MHKTKAIITIYIESSVLLICKHLSSKHTKAKVNEQYLHCDWLFAEQSPCSYTDIPLLFLVIWADGEAEPADGQTLSNWLDMLRLRMVVSPSAYLSLACFQPPLSHK